LRQASDRRHLLNDVRVAEELGVRYNDSHRTRDSVLPGAPQTRDECDGRMLKAITERHNITFADVLSARQRLASFRWDPAVHVPLAVVYVAIAFMLARAIRNRFSADEKPALIVASLFVAVILGGLMLAFAQLWGGIVEMIRVGNQHMSYRGLRLGWRQYSPAVFVTAIVLFWLVVALTYRTPAVQRGTSGVPLRLRGIQ
jgi:hypothetical protein